jgi:uroporphyrinogen decarboxylase
MDKRDRVRDVLSGRKADRVPTGFWYHFDESRQNGEAAVQAHVDFLDQTDVDMLKIMNENLYRLEKPPADAAGWRAVASLPLSAPMYQRQLEVTERVLNETGASAYTLITVHGVFASAFHALGLPDAHFASANPVEHHIHHDAESVAMGLRAIGDSLLEFTRQCVEMGVDGIYYAALGGESYRRYSNEQFEQAIGATERYLLAEMTKLPADLFVHICKDRVDFSRYRGYPGDVFNWATHSNDLTISQGYEHFGKPILGGFDDRSGALVEGSLEEITEEAQELLRAHEDVPFMLGADCTLPTNLETDRIRAAVRGVQEYSAADGR